MKGDITLAVPPKIRYSFMIDETQRDGLRAVKERDGIGEAEQIRRALDTWLESKGVAKKKTAHRRASTRRKA